MRETVSLRSFERARRGYGRLLAQIARIGLALAFVVSLLDVQSALARAEAPGAHGIACCVHVIDHQDDDAPGAVSALEHAAHLAGHLTFVVDPATLSIATLDMTRARQPIPAESLPRSTTLPAPSEPPRA